MSKRQRRDDQRIELADGWAQYLGDGYFLLGQISDGPNDDDVEVPRPQGSGRHESVVVSMADIHRMIQVWFGPESAIAA
ncbi:MAG TPA: hypothetical protein VF759_10125 [Allosphingosinicella sp.]|jgi:hypothetical protein